jgi:hypothetical protein
LIIDDLINSFKEERIMELRFSIKMVGNGASILKIRVHQATSWLTKFVTSQKIVN